MLVSICHCTRQGAKTSATKMSMSLPFLLENDASLRVFYSTQQRHDSQRNYNQHIDTPKRAFALTLSIKCRYADCGDLFFCCAECRSVCTTVNYAFYSYAGTCPIKHRVAI